MCIRDTCKQYVMCMCNMFRVCVIYFQVGSCPPKISPKVLCLGRAGGVEGGAWQMVLYKSLSTHILTSLHTYDTNSLDLHLCTRHAKYQYLCRICVDTHIHTYDTNSTQILTQIVISLDLHLCTRHATCTHIAYMSHVSLCMSHVSLYDV